MKTNNNHWIRGASVACLLLFAGIIQAEERVTPPNMTAAVLDFQVSQEGSEGVSLLGKSELNKGTGKDVSILLNAKLSEVPNLILVERQEIDKILSEKELGLSGLVTPESAAKIGNLIGAKVLITGRVFQSAGKVFMVSKVIGTETGRVYAETVTIPDLSGLESGIQQLALKVNGIMEGRYDTLIAKVEPPEARFERWKKLVEGKKLPSVSVQVTENHLQRPILDPAVETEMRHLLQKLGFQVIDGKESTENAEFTIRGEAFSERGGQKGNLVSCRSRVEIKVLKGKSGQLLLTDRQTDVAIDLGENMAAKQALQNAAIKLLDRILPKLVGNS